MPENAYLKSSIKAKLQAQCERNGREILVSSFHTCKLFCSKVGSVGGGMQCHRYGRAKGRALHFSLLKMLLLEYHVTAKQQTIRIITFKHIFCWTFLDSLRNCWQSTGVRKCDVITRFISVLRLHGCVAEERYKTAESLPVLR